MSIKRIPGKVKLFASVIYAEEIEINILLNNVESLMGKIDFTSEDIPFNYTKYYEGEMGQNLRRRFLTFFTHVARDGIYTYKNIGSAIETNFKRSNGTRCVNIDPGYLSLENLVLLTYKGYAHRIYLADGIYGDLTLIYERGGFKPLPWTYRDYIDNIPLFERIREEYYIGQKGT